MSTDERLLDLLTAKATEGIGSGERAELQRLLGVQRDWREDDLELAAAAVHVHEIEISGLEPMPGPLRELVLAEAARNVTTPARGDAADVVQFDATRREPRRGFDVRGLGWYAAAAMLVLAIWAPWAERGSATATATGEPDVATQRARLLSEARDAVTVAWAGAEPAYEGVSGDVVWSTAAQAGFMRLRGLPANLPDRQQYQLWIVDPKRDAEPVDGGVFDIPPGSDEVIVPIDPKLAIGAPTVFAITLEQPGGVVVSEGPLLVVAPLT